MVAEPSDGQYTDHCVYQQERELIQKFYEMNLCTVYNPFVSLVSYHAVYLLVIALPHTINVSSDLRSTDYTSLRSATA
jgi:hypothetical protein